MLSIDQTILGSPHGNCFQACVASIMELSLEEVPHFCDNKNSSWFLDFENWLQNFDFAPLMVLSDGCPTLDNAYSIASGPSDRGLLHSVVYFGNEMVHDPHPDKTGLQKVQDFIFFVKQDPRTK